MSKRQVNCESEAWLPHKLFMLATGALLSWFIIYFYSNFRGAGKAEIKPYEPDAGNAAEGKSRNILSQSLFLKFY